MIKTMKYNVDKSIEDNSKIWRYMDLMKFANMLEKRALFFPRADKLGDKFEGSFPKRSLGKRGEESVAKPNDGKTLSEFFKLYKTRTVVSCWHVSNHESIAMWRLYSGESSGIAVQSTIGKLKASISQAIPETIYLGAVKYIDYETGICPNEPKAPYFHKRASFQHEKELRLLIQRFKTNSKQKADSPNATFDAGLYVPVSIDQLIEGIYISPTCEPWQREVVKSILKHYQINKEVFHSKLDDSPIY